MTLYNHFASKEALVGAVYEDLMTTTLASIYENISKNEEERVLALFSLFERKAKDGSGRGWPFVPNAAATIQQLDREHGNVLPRWAAMGKPGTRRRRRRSKLNRETALPESQKTALHDGTLHLNLTPNRLSGSRLGMWAPPEPRISGKKH